MCTGKVNVVVNCSGCASGTDVTPMVRVCKIVRFEGLVVKCLPSVRLAYEPKVELETGINKNDVWNRTNASILEVCVVKVHVSCVFSTLNAKVGTIGTLVNRVVNSPCVLVAAVRNKFCCGCRNWLFCPRLESCWSWLLCKELAEGISSDILGSGGFHPGFERHFYSEVVVMTELDVERRKHETGTKRRNFPKSETARS